MPESPVQSCTPDGPLEALARLVKTARDHQKAYFRSKVGLAQCKRVEAELDRAVAAILNPPAPGLFDREEA